MKQFIEWNKLPLKKYSGREALRCPACDEVRTDKKDKSLKIQHDKGFGSCFYCKALTFRDSVTDTFKEKVYTFPKQEWKNYTNLPDKLVKWVWSERNISQNTLNQLEITQEEVYFPQIQKKQNAIVFNYFEGETLVNKKYRGVANINGETKKLFISHTGGKPIFYNINSIINCDEVYIVEGEFDVLALYEIGIKNAISLPNGANDNDDFWINSEKYLKDVKKFIIATDNDQKGIEVREKIAQRLGRYRCVYIEFDSKDANDDLKLGKLTNSIKKEHRFNIGGTFTSFDLIDQTLKLYHEGMPKTIYPVNPCFGDLKNIFSVMNGQLTVVTGIPSHGKSSFNDWYILNLINDYDYKLSVFSPEHNPLELYNSSYARLATGKAFFGNNRMSESELLDYIEWSREKIYYTTSEQGLDPTWDWLLDKFKEQMFTYGVNIFVVDAWNKVQMPNGMNGKDGIDKILTQLTNFCIQYNVMMFLVVHPTKMKKDTQGAYEIPTLYDCSGSSDFRNQTHNGYTVYRVFDTDEVEGSTMFINQKTKFDFQGKIGESINFKYDLDSKRFYANGIKPNFNMTKKNQEIEPINYFEPNTKFDECPF
jgi:twinkle protein